MKFPRLSKAFYLDYSYLIAFGFSLVMFITFLWAYLFNNNVFSVNINVWGEAHFEFIMLTFFIFPFLFYGLFLRYKEYKKIKKEVKKI